MPILVDRRVLTVLACSRMQTVARLVSRPFLQFTRPSFPKMYQLEDMLETALLTREATTTPPEQTHVPGNAKAPIRSVSGTPVYRMCPSESTTRPRTLILCTAIA